MAMRVNGNITGSVSNSKANMSGKLTTGIVNIGGGTNDGYSKEEVDELLNGKANVEHEHYIKSGIQELTLQEAYNGLKTSKVTQLQVNQTISEYAAPKVHTHEDIQSQIDDLKTSVSNGKTLLASAITDKGVSTLATDTFQTMANNIKEIPQEGGGSNYYEDLYNARTSNGTNMSGLFSRISGNDIDLTKLDVSKSTKMSYMFDNSTASSIDITGWDTSKVTSMERMFNYCKSAIICNTPLNTDNVTNVEGMFYESTINDISFISSLRFPNLVRLKSTFESANINTKLDLSTWDISNITNMEYAFSSIKCKKIDLSNWNTNKVTSMNYMFNTYSSNIEELIIPDWDMTNVKTRTTFFPSNVSYTKNLRLIDLSRSNEYTINLFATTYLPKRSETTYGDIIIPEDSSQAVIDAIIAKYWRPIGPKFNIESFQITSELDEILLNKKTKIVYHSPSTWYAVIGEIEFISSDDSIATVNENGEVSAISLGSVDIYARLKDNPEVTSNTITINVSETDSTPYVIKFKGTKTPSNHYVKINGSNVKLSSMNYDANTGVYTYDVGKEITSIQFNGYGTIAYADTITELLKFDFNGNNVTDMSSMFKFCSSLTSLDVSNWDTSNVTGMSYVFQNCMSLASLDVSNWDTSNVIYMHCTFEYCYSLTSLDVSNWNTENVTDTVCMFDDCYSLTSLDLTSWNTKNVSSDYAMFNGVTCDITITDSIWHSRMTEKQTGFTGTFIRV